MEIDDNDLENQFQNVNQKLIQYYTPDGLCGIISVFMVCESLGISFDLNDLINDADKIKKIDNRCDTGYSILDIYYAVSKIPNIEFEMYFDYKSFKATNQKEYQKSIEYLESIDFIKFFKNPITIDEIIKKSDDYLPILAYKSYPSDEHHFSHLLFENKIQCLIFGCPETEGSKTIYGQIKKKKFVDYCWKDDEEFGNCLIIKNKQLVAKNKKDKK